MAARDADPAAPPVILGEEPSGASTDGDLADWTSFAPLTRLEEGDTTARGWISITRDRMRFAIDARTPASGSLGGLPIEVQVHVGLSHPELPAPDQEEASAEACVDWRLGDQCGPDFRPCYTRHQAGAFCDRFVPRSREIREVLARSFHQTYTIRETSVWALGSEVPGAHAVVRRTRDGYRIEAELPSDALPKAAHAPLASARYAFELQVGDTRLAPPGLDRARPETYAVARMSKAVRFGAVPVVLEALSAPLFMYQPGPATSSATVLGDEYDAPDQARAIVELPVDVGGGTILTRKGSTSLARLVAPTRQGAQTSERLLVLEGNDLVREVGIAGKIVAHGALDDHYVVLVSDLESYSYHFHTLHRADVSVVRFDASLESETHENLFGSSCRGVLGAKPSVRGIAVTLHCTTGGYDSDEPFRRLPTKRLTVAWNDLTASYSVKVR